MNKEADFQPLAQSSPGQNSQYGLRILATSDIHGAILPYDYATGLTSARFGLARTASLIAAARRESRHPCLLVDNGDFLQGTPLSDLHDVAGDGGQHPVIAAMNRLGYDAVNLGNHEFNFGLPALRAALAQAGFPVICANALTRRGRSVAEDLTLMPPSRIAEREFEDETGARHRLRIGLLGLLPPQIIAWDRFHLGREIGVRDMVETAAARVPMLRAQGADLVVLLAHTGVERGPGDAGSENAALALARVPGVNVIVAGHSHEVFPDRDAPGAAGDGPDHREGTFFGVPAVMPGFRGSHLGVIDLALSHGPSGWRIAGHRAEVRSVAAASDLCETAPHPAVVAAVRASHAATLSHMQRPIGRTAQPIHSYLSQFRCDLPVRLVAEAQRVAVARALTGGPLGGLPVLSATAPFHTGGRAGPEAYTDIPAGPLTLRSATDLQPFPNTLCALWLTGAELRDWLERAVSCFHRIRPDVPDQQLWDTRFPGHAADSVTGLSYRIDLTCPPLYDDRGIRLGRGDSPGRIRALCHRGRPVAPEARFVMAVNSYRACGGGPYPALSEDRLVYSSRTPVRDVLAEFIRDGGVGQLDTTPAWVFLTVPGASAVIETGPGLRRHPPDIAALELTELGLTDAGFVRLRLPLSGAGCTSDA